MPITSSSTSSSERDAAAGWRAFPAAFLAAALSLAVVFLASAYVLDPYDTGRSPLSAEPAIRPQGPRVAAASRGRDPGFSGAVIGNSRIQLLSPERLRDRTGIPFVQLSVPGSGPREQLTLIHWFLRHHPEGSARALVLSVDDGWCGGDSNSPLLQPFPFWLFSSDLADYLLGLARYSVLEELPRRLGFLLSADPERARPDGYWDYEPEYFRIGQADDPRLVAAREQRWPDDAIANPTGRYPGAERLAALLRVLPPDMAVVLVFPPIYAVGLSNPGSPRAKEEAACKAAFASAASARPKTSVVDWRVDRPETRDPALFFDQTHYRQALAKLVERDVATALRRMEDEPPEPPQPRRAN